MFANEASARRSRVSQPAGFQLGTTTGPHCAPSHCTSCPLTRTVPNACVKMPAFELEVDVVPASPRWNFTTLTGVATVPVQPQICTDASPCVRYDEPSVTAS